MEFENQNMNIDLSIETLEQIRSTLGTGDSRKIDIDLTGELLKKFKIKECKYPGTCPSCSTHNEAWIGRSKTVKKDLCFCWHCGQRVIVKAGD